jgi:hypothetical protein
VEFGTWRDEPITWRVLAIEDGRALLISEDILTMRQYDDLDVDSYDQINFDIASTTWAESDIRTWLNGEFLETVFTKGEQRAIDLSHLSNPDNPEFGTEGGPDTEDMVFLLNIDQANRYFSDDDDRWAYITMTEEDVEYALRLLKDYFGYDRERLSDHENFLRDDYLSQSVPERWFLRSPGKSGYQAAYSYGSSFDEYWFIGDVYQDYGIRPALWLNL